MNGLFSLISGHQEPLMPNPSVRRAQTWKAFLRFWIPVVLLLAVAFAVCAKFVEPAPPPALSP